MEIFLEKVIDDILSKDFSIGDCVFILPNQRAGIYLKKHLKNTLNKTSFFPEFITFDNFAEQISGIKKMDTISLLFEFYQTYQQQTPPQKTESFDTFSNWATTVLSDFNEIDAYLVDPKLIFSNLKELNEIQNWEPNTEITKNYLAFFKDLENYYFSFYQKLVYKKNAYQGLIFREAVASIQSYVANTSKHFFFVGFNHLKSSESQIIQELLEAKKANVYWNISEELIENNHLAGYFIRKYLKEWPYYSRNDINWVSKEKFNPKKIEITGIPKNVGMLKYAGELLKKTEKTEDTALVLADQNLLSIALNSLPESLVDINITMGFPLKNLPFSDLINAIFDAHIYTQAQNNNAFYYKMLLKILDHPIIKTHFSKIEKLTQEINESNIIYFDFALITEYIKKHQIDNSEVLLTLFSSIKQNALKFLKILDYFILFIKTKVSGQEREVVYRHYKLNQQFLLLADKYQDFLKVESQGLKTLYKIYKQILFSENLNFIGEPLKGLQLMGFLETQTLNFDYLIMTSVNESVLPKGKNNNSFIPYDIKKHFGLRTYREENAISAYHFYRLIQASNKVNLLYNNETDSFGGGEKSQFITQLLWRYPSIKQVYINPKIPTDTIKEKIIYKTPEVIENLKSIAIKGFSPSALTSYIYNPLQFYQQKILGIDEHKEMEEIMANNTMGTVIHDSLENLYKPYIGNILSVKMLEEILEKIPDQVQKEFQNNYTNGQYKLGKNRLIYEVIIQFINRFVNAEIRAIQSGKVIRLLALELSLSRVVHFSNFNFPIRLKGIVDRVDEVDGVLRIIDYKSGKVINSQLYVRDYSLFIEDYKYAKAFQVLLYAFLFLEHKSFDKTKKLQAGIISFKNLNEGFLPINYGTNKKSDMDITPERLHEFLQMVQDLLIGIFDQKMPFKEK
jgi:hypothetical protein